jgi:hypothetical protein
MEVMPNSLGAPRPIDPEDVVGSVMLRTAAPRQYRRLRVRAVTVTCAVPTKAPIWTPNRITSTSLDVQKGRFTSGNRPFCGPLARQKSCKSWDSVVPNDSDSLH